MFDRLIELLPNSLAPTAIDLPADGAKAAGVHGYSVRSLTRYLATVLEHLHSPANGLAKAVVIGTSSGGYLAQQLAVDRPELLGGLVLVGSPISLEGSPAFAADVEALTDPVDAGNDALLGRPHLDLVAAIPNARLAVYENTGPLILWERPDRVAADVADFVDTLGSHTSAGPLI